MLSSFVPDSTSDSDFLLLSKALLSNNLSPRLARVGTPEPLLDKDTPTGTVEEEVASVLCLLTRAFANEIEALLLVEVVSDSC